MGFPRGIGGYTWYTVTQPSNEDIISHGCACRDYCQTLSQRMCISLFFPEIYAQQVSKVSLDSTFPYTKSGPHPHLTGSLDPPTSGAAPVV